MQSHRPNFYSAIADDTVTHREWLGQLVSRSHDTQMGIVGTFWGDEQKRRLWPLHSTSRDAIERSLKDGIINILAVRQLNADGGSPHPNDFPLQALGCPLDY